MFNSIQSSKSLNMTYANAPYLLRYARREFGECMDIINKADDLFIRQHLHGLVDDFRRRAVCLITKSYMRVRLSAIASQLVRNISSFLSCIRTLLHTRKLNCLRAQNHELSSSLHAHRTPLCTFIHRTAARLRQ